MEQTKVALITGASRGIGKAVAINLAKEKFSLGLIGRDQEKMRLVVQECEDLGIKVQCAFTNLDNPQSLKKIVEQFAETLGGISVLINNAGISIESHIREASVADFDATLKVNLRSVFALTKYALPYLEKAERAAIINIASVASRKTYQGGAMYCASKHGLLAMGQSIFEDIKESGIKVCSILPGYVNTDMHAKNSRLTPELMVQPEDIAHTVNFVINFPKNACPTEITILPQRSPRK